MIRVAILLSFFVSLLFAVHTKKLEHFSVQLSWKYQFNFAGFIIAKEKGFYKDVGLDVELREYKHGMDIVEEVLSQRADVGIYNSQILLEYLQGKPIVLLGSFFKRAALVLVTQPEIQSPKDLVDKKVMAATKEDFVMNFKPYFDKYGVDIDSIKLLPHSFRIDEFAEKKVDAMTAFFSNEIPKLQKRGVAFHILDPSDDNLFIMQMELFTSQKELQKHPEHIKKFLQATIKGWEYTFSHKQEAIDIIYKKYNRGFSKEDIKQEAEAVERLILPYTYEIGSIDRGFLKKQAKLFTKNYHISNPPLLNNYIFDPYEDSLELTFKEARFIANHPEVTICPHYSLFPLDGFDKQKHIGIMGDVFDRISEKTGLTFKVVASKNLHEMEQNVLQKRCEIVPIVTPKIAKKFHMYATKVISSSYFSLLTTIDKSFIKNPIELQGKKLLMKDRYLSDYIKQCYPYLNIEIVPDEHTMVEMLLKKRAFAIITLDEQSDYFIDKYGFGKLKLGGFLAKERPIKGVIAIQKDKPVLASIIQKALYSIPKSELEAIHSRWQMTRYHNKVDYTLLFEVLAVVFIIFAILIYYQRKIKRFNQILEERVKQKTKELQTLNEQLEALVQEKVEEIIQKDRILAIQSKQAIMGEMITMIAHQWRQPLNTVTLQISNLQLRRIMGEKISIEEYDEILEYISKTISYLSETIDDFQTFFHADRELETIALVDLVQKAVNFILPRLKGKKIDVIVDIPKELEVRVYINELIQVLLNILNNAIDALLECHETRAKKIEIDAKEKADEIQIYIRDTACGIKEEDIQKVFEPYFSTKGKNGTGLGLYMSQMIIQKQFGGDITLQSSKEGTTFIIKLPKI